MPVFRRTDFKLFTVCCEAMQNYWKDGYLKVMEGMGGPALRTLLYHPDHENQDQHREMYIEHCPHCGQKVEFKS